MQRARGSALTRGAIRTLVVAGTAVSVVLGMVVLAFPAGAQALRTYQARQVISGKSLHHWYTRAGSSAKHREALTQPDDITRAGGNLFTAFQNGVGPQGQGSADGNRDSTSVEVGPNGRVGRQLYIRCKCDGRTADPY